MTEHLLQLADRDLREIATAIQGGRLVAPFTPMGLRRLLPSMETDAVATELQQLTDQGFAPGQVGAVLELLVQDRVRRPKLEEVLDLVTTGPETSGAASRDTSVVVRELFAGAQHSVLVAGYAVYQGQSVFQALADRMQELPQLAVRMFLDVQRGPGDTSTGRDIARRFAERFRARQWPPGRPLPQVFYDPRSLELNAEKRACLHAKCVVVDKRAVFVSSANFTEAAQQRNIEVGLLVTLRQLGEQIVNHFDVLIGAGRLEQVL